MARSLTKTESRLVDVQDAPPSVLLNTPLLLFGVPAYSVVGVDGSTASVMLTARSPVLAGTQLAPPLVLLNTPFPSVLA